MGLQTQPNFVIKPGSPKHFEAMALIAERTSCERAGQPIPTELSTHSEELEKLQERSQYEGFWSHIAAVGEKVVGYSAGYAGDAWNKPESDGFGMVVPSEHLWMLMVDPSHYRRGIGRLLLRATADDCYNRGARQLTLHTYADNHRARSLYESEGFVRRFASRRTPDNKVKYSLNLI